MANDGHIAKNTLLEPERLAARAIYWDRRDRGLSSGRAEISLQSRHLIHGGNRSYASFNRNALPPREPSIHGSSPMANGLGIGPSEAETFWTEFLRALRARGLGGVRLVISDAHTGLKAAIARVFEATRQRCRVRWMRNALAHVSRGQHTVVAALSIVLGPTVDNRSFRQAFDQPDRAHAGETWRKVAEQLRPRWPKLGDLMDASEHDVLVYMTFSRQHRTKLHTANPIERLNKEVKHRADVVGVRAFPSDRWQSCHYSPTSPRSCA
jgi:hypothetical protein